MKKAFRFLSILLVISALTLAVPAAGAVDLPYEDSEDIHYSLAVLMLSDLGVVSGYPDGTFRPDETVTRAEAAKLIASVLTRYQDIDEMEFDANPFSDIEDSWAEQYILFLYERGIVSGYASGRFDPYGPVTAEQFAKMLFIALGHDRSLFVGENWREAVGDMAAELELYRDFVGYGEDELTRESASLLLFNALQCDIIQSYDEDGEPVYYLDDLMNPISMIELFWDVTKYSAIVTGNEFADLTGETQRLEKGYTKIQYHKEFEVSTDLGYLGREVNIFVNASGRVVGKPSFSDSDIVVTAEGRSVLDQILQFNDLNIGDSTEVYINYSLVETSEFESIKERDTVTIIDRGGDGIIDVVLIVRYKDVTIAEITDDAYILAEGGGFGGSLEFDLLAEDVYEPEVDETVSVAQIGGLFYIVRK